MFAIFAQKELTSTKIGTTSRSILMFRMRPHNSFPTRFNYFPMISGLLDIGFLVNVGFFDDVIVKIADVRKNNGVIEKVKVAAESS